MKSRSLKISFLAFALLNVSNLALANTALKATMKSMGTQFGGVAGFINAPGSVNATADAVMDAIVQTRVIEFHLQLVNDRADGEMIPDKVAILSGSERDVKIDEVRALLQQTSDEVVNLENLLSAAKSGPLPRDFSHAKISIQKIGSLIAKSHQLFK